MNAAIMCDFDGTITDDDVAQLIFDRFGSTMWWDLENRFRRGEISCKNALVGEFSTVRGERKEIEDFVSNYVCISPSFDRFIETCGKRNVPVYVVSDGLDFYVNLILSKVGLDGMKVFCNKAIFEDGRVRINFPYGNSECEKCGNCKTQHLKKLKKKGYYVIYVGDGYSDMCAAKQADYIIAKSYLLDFCRSNKIACGTFKTFEDVVGLVNKKLDELGNGKSTQQETATDPMRSI